MPGAISDDNLFFHPSRPPQFQDVGNSTGFNDLQQWKTHTNLDTRSTVGDPQFKSSPDASAYVLQPTSPAINTARVDEGNASQDQRCNGGPDKGAVESDCALVPPSDLTCSTETTLDALISCITAHFGSFTVPSDEAKADFRTAMRAMLNGACHTIALGPSLAGIYQVTTRTDTQNGKRYCVLMEIADADNNGMVDRGWGTFIVSPLAARELNIAISHPLDDQTTEVQGIGVFKGTDSRSFLLAGAKRDLGGSSTCQTDQAVSDAAHNIDHMFFAATQELNAWYGSRSWTQLQFHGMTEDRCPDTQVHMTYGVATPPGPSDPIRTLKAMLLKYSANPAANQPAWTVTLAGESPCNLNGTKNTEGRLLNRVPVVPPEPTTSVCPLEADATSYSRKFIHIEQDPNMRGAAVWTQAVIDTWPVAPPSGTGVDAKIQIVWPHAGGSASVPVADAPLVNVEVYLYERGTQNPVPMGFSNTVTLHWASNHPSTSGHLAPAHGSVIGVRAEKAVDSKRFVYWQFNDVACCADAEHSKYYFFVTVEGVEYRTNVWAHAADALTFMPSNEVPESVAGTDGGAVDSQIRIIWPHDAFGSVQPVTNAPLVNVGVDVLQHQSGNGQSTSSVPLGFGHRVRLMRSLNDGYLEPIATGEKITRMAGQLYWPRWEFNDVDVSAAQDRANRYYFMALAEGVETHPTIWVHGADGRTYFPLRDIPAQGSQE